MQILCIEYEKILYYCPPVPPEVGGLLGMVGKVIVAHTMDYGEMDNERAIYKPSINLLNDQIKQWQMQKIKFAGIFHSHPQGQYKLSLDDEQYINRIMNVMPLELSTLYFPVVLPQFGIFPYVARRTDFGITISSDSIQLIDERRFQNE